MPALEPGALGRLACRARGTCAGAGRPRRATWWRRLGDMEPRFSHSAVTGAVTRADRAVSPWRPRNTTRPRRAPCPARSASRRPPSPASTAGSCRPTPGAPTARSPTTPTSCWHHRGVLKAVFSFEQKVAKWDRLDPNLKSYAQLASAGTIGCSWCLDFGYFLAHNDGLDLAKVREVPRWRESDVFTAARARRAGVRRGDDRDAAHRHRRDGRRPARAARRRGGGGADPDGRPGEHALPLQLRGGPAEPGLLRRLRAAPGPASAALPSDA